jgi:hypothetical protein
MELQKTIEVENDRGETEVGVIEKIDANGEITVRVLVNNKILVFKPEFKIQ